MRPQTACALDEKGLTFRSRGRGWTQLLLHTATEEAASAEKKTLNCRNIFVELTFVP